MGRPLFFFNPKNLGIQILIDFFFLCITTAVFFLGTFCVWARVKVQSPTLKAKVLTYLRGSGLPVLYSPLGTGSTECLKIPGIDAAVMADAQLQTLHMFGR